MKETIEEKLIAEISNIDKRIEYLKERIEKYKEENDYYNAMQTNIKYRELKTVSQLLKRIIK